MQKELRFTTSFILGTVAAFFSSLLYSACVMLVYKLIVYKNSRDFVNSILSSIDIWLSVLLLASILYGFCVSIVYLMRNLSELKSKIILNIVFFITTVLIILIMISYVPSVRLFNNTAGKSFLIFIPVILIIVVSLHFYLSIKSNIFKIFKFILKITRFDSGIYFKDPNKDKKIMYAQMKRDKYTYFNNTIKNLLVFAYNNKANMGLMCFKITNYSDIITRYGEKIYKSVIEPQIFSCMKEIKTFSNHDCFLHENYIYSFLYGNEKDVFVLSDRYNKAFKSYKFICENEYVPVSIVVSASGFDFSKSHDFNTDIMARDLLNRIKKASAEAYETSSPVVYYE